MNDIFGFDWMQGEKDSMSISIAASHLNWDRIKANAKSRGHNLVSGYTQMLYEKDDLEIRRIPYYKGILKLAVVLSLILLAILIIVRF
jgi:hypothetical protein